MATEREKFMHTGNALLYDALILDMPELGDRRPSQLLATMLEFCPKGEVASTFFRASFLRCLLKEIRVMLTDEVIGDLKDLAVRADKLF